VLVRRLGGTGVFCASWQANSAQVKCGVT